MNTMQDAGPIVTLKVPATTANMGPGFDTFGMALSLHNRFSVTDVLPEGRFTVRVTGEGAQELGDVEKNLLVKSYCRACDEWGVVNSPKNDYRSQNGPHAVSDGPQQVMMTRAVLSAGKT